MYIYTKVRNNIRKPSDESLRRTAAVRSIFMSNKSMSRLCLFAQTVPQMNNRLYFYIIVLIASAICLMVHAQRISILIIHAMNRTSPGRHDGDFRLKVSITPL